MNDPVPTPWPVQQDAPDPLAQAADLRVLLEAWPAPSQPAPSAPRGRLFGRVRRALADGATFANRRQHQPAWSVLAPGVRAQTLYEAEAAGTRLRPGEPSRARIIELAAGAAWSCPASDAREWLVLQGTLCLDGSALAELAFRTDKGQALPLSSAGGARVYLREAPRANVAATSLQLDAPALWQAFGPGTLRRVLWTDGHQAALLYRTSPGAQVPHHGHHHDEECLMLAGEMFLDDVLLRAGEYQLAPAGSAHHEVSSDTGCLLFAHGDLELALR